MIPLWGKIHQDYFKENHRAKLIQLPYGHYIYREAPELTARLITRFLG